MARYKAGSRPRRKYALATRGSARGLLNVRSASPAIARKEKNGRVKTHLSYAVLVILAQNTMTSLVLTETDAGSTRSARRGETVELRLKENPSTGYRWSVGIEPAGAASIVGSRFVPAGPGAGAAGSAAFEIVADRPGAFELQAKLWRQWEGEGSVKKRYSVALRVR